MVIWFEDLRRADVATVGGKNSSLGEMVKTLATEGVMVPNGFATTSDAFWRYVDENQLRARATAFLDDYAAGRMSLAETGHAIRTAFLRGEFPEDIANDIRGAYRKLSAAVGQERTGRRRALQRHRRGSARRELRRPAGNLPQHPRREGPARRLPPLLRLAVHRPRHRLSPGQGLRSHEGRALRRRAAHGALRSSAVRA